jgi:hypothetical protein
MSLWHARSVIDQLVQKTKILGKEKEQIIKLALLRKKIFVRR